MDPESVSDTVRLEHKWQALWRTKEVFRWDDDDPREKYYILEMFPYTSGRLHMGHARNFTMGDVLARFQRARGYNVLYPMGWDAFGLPAENAAITQGIHPYVSTQAAIENMRNGMDQLGLSYDWSCEVNTSSPEYVAAQQEIFLRFFEAGLVYRNTRFANWCEKDQTVLADEQVVDGHCWRCDGVVTKRRIAQWFFDIRRYADELIDALDGLEEWPDRVKNIQRSWIGRSFGTTIKFPFVHAQDNAIEAFTTRVDTLMGCTFLLLAPEHDVLDVGEVPADYCSRVNEFRQRILSQSRTDRIEMKVKEGVDTGWRVTNPLTGDEIPVWVANYVLADYGTGAVMAVPAHDQRDLDFARKYALPVRVVISPDGSSMEVSDQAYEGDGLLINSGGFDGLNSHDATERIQDDLAAMGSGSVAKMFRIQNWSVSRQRYWGNPIPVIYCNDDGAVAVPRSELPILLPVEVDFANSGRSILQDEAFRSVACPKCGKPGRREVDTMDTFVDSSWYFMRYLSSKQSEPVDHRLCDEMLPVDIYIGGIEHATLHLIYARFFVKAMRDLGMISIDEPFRRLENHGMVNDAYGQKQSKSKGNITEPSSVISVFGADALRVYLLFATSSHNPINWEDDGPRSALHYLQRVERLVDSVVSAVDSAATKSSADPSILKYRRLSHQTIRLVADDLERFQFNTAIAKLMTLTNELLAYPEDGPAEVALECTGILLKLLAPFAPHLAEEFWVRLGNDGLLAQAAWPEINHDVLVEESEEVAIQVNGKFVARLEVPVLSDEHFVTEAAMKLERVTARVGLSKPIQIVFVPGRVLNIVL